MLLLFSFQVFGLRCFDSRRPPVLAPLALSRVLEMKESDKTTTEADITQGMADLKEHMFEKTRKVFEKT